MILSITLNPCVDRTIFIDGLNVNDANRVARTEMDAGGKGINAARVIAELGEEVIATGFLGGDTGGLVKFILQREGVQMDFIETCQETRLNISVEDGTGNPPTTFNEKGQEIDADNLQTISEIITKWMVGCKYVAAGGSLPPNVPADAYAKMVHRARELGTKIAIDADGTPLKEAIKAGPYLVKPNAGEATRLLGREIAGREPGLKAAAEIHGMGAQIAIVSMGKEGAALAADGVRLFGEPPRVETKSTIGAGDSLIGGFLVAAKRGGSIEEAFRLGIAAGAATACTDGSEIGRKSVIESLLPKVIIHRA